MFDHVKLTNLRNSEFVQFFQHLDKLVLKYDATALGIDAVYTPLKDNSDKLTVLYKQKMGSDLSEEIAMADKRRDDALNGLIALTKAYKYSFNETIRTAALDLYNSIEFYGDTIARLNYAAETSTINDLVSKWRNDEKLAAAVATIDQEPWLNELDEANNAFDTLFLSRIDESANNPEINFRDIRIEMAEQYTTLLKYIEAFSLIKGEELYKPLAERLNVLIGEYDRMLDMRKAKSNANKEAEVTENVNE
ncbi:DUF6261 family protein [Saccharicrinis aurantiacus]|uniref:DUF6261 family protein n=1 Tax=Saccharicrinis aurantiacus TaxID=1849719 RepID=UPI00094FCA34|nr:DUF6261 family protein [Saccharicrinis aurantiacus]